MFHFVQHSNQPYWNQRKYQRRYFKSLSWSRGNHFLRLFNNKLQIPHNLTAVAAHSLWRV